MNLSNLSVTNKKLSQIKTATKADPAIQSISYCLNEWPNPKSKVTNEAKPFFNIRQDLHTADDLLFKNNQLIIHTSMRSKILNITYEGH